MAKSFVENNQKSGKVLKKLSIKILKDLKDVIALGIEVGNKSAQEASEDLYGSRFTEKRSYIYSEEFIIKLNTIPEDIVDYYGKMIIDEVMSRI